jgi:nucleoside-triphosphatase THEP1
MILVLTGPVHAGKTGFLKNILPVLKVWGIPVSGYLSSSILKQGRLSGYDLFDIKTGKSVPFLRRRGRTGWQRVGPYYFLPSGLRAAENTILSCAEGEWLIVDEVGPQELAGRGVWPALSTFLSRPELDCLLVVRRPLLEDVRRLLGTRPIEVLDIESETILPSLLERLLRSSLDAVSKKSADKRRGDI